jgi:ankyrin repeat protein
MAKIKIKANEFVADVRGGLRDSDLRDKYDLSDRQLGKLFEKLLDQGRLKLSDLDDKTQVFEATLELASTCPHCGSLILVETDRCPNCERPLELQETANPDAGLSPETSDERDSSRDDEIQDHTVRLDGLEFDLFQAEHSLDATPSVQESDDVSRIAAPEPPADDPREVLEYDEEPLALDDLDFDLTQANEEQYEEAGSMTQSLSPGLEQDSLVLDDLEFDLTTHDGIEYELGRDASSDALDGSEIEAGPSATDDDDGAAEAFADTEGTDDPEFELILPDAKPDASTGATRPDGKVELPAASERPISPIPDKDLLSGDSLAIGPEDYLEQDTAVPDRDRIDLTLETGAPLPPQAADSRFNAKRLVGFAAGSALAAGVILVVAGLVTGMISLPTHALLKPAWLLNTFSRGDDASVVRKAELEPRTKTSKPKVPSNQGTPPTAGKLEEKRPTNQGVPTIPTNEADGVSKTEGIDEPNGVEEGDAITEEASTEPFTGEPGLDASGDQKVAAVPTPTPSFTPSDPPKPTAAPPVPVAPRRAPEERVELYSGKQLPAAVKAGDLERVKQLLDAGADVDARDALGVPAIVSAVSGGSEPMTTLLLNSGANVGLGDNNGSTALRIACESGRKGLVKLLVAKDEGRGAGLFLEVCRKGRTDWVRLLLEGGAPIDAKDANGNTGLMLASGNGRLEVARFLLEKGADVRLKNHKGVTALGWARAPSGQNYVALPIRREMVRMLKERTQARRSLSRQR